MNYIKTARIMKSIYDRLSAMSNPIGYLNDIMSFDQKMVDLNINKILFKELLERNKQ